MTLRRTISMRIVSLALFFLPRRVRREIKALLVQYWTGLEVRKSVWTTEIPTSTGWYVVRELLHNDGAEWYRPTLIKLEREMFKLIIATDDYFPKRPFKPAQGAEYLRLEEM